MNDRITWLLMAVLIAACLICSSRAQGAESADHDRIIALEYEMRDAQDVSGVVALLDNRLQHIEETLNVVEVLGGAIAATGLGLLADAIKRRWAR